MATEANDKKVRFRTKYLGKRYFTEQNFIKKNIKKFFSPSSENPITITIIYVAELNRN